MTKNLEKSFGLFNVMNDWHGCGHRCPSESFDLKMQVQGRCRTPPLRFCLPPMRRNFIGRLRSFYSFFRDHNKAFTPAPALGKHPLTDG